MSCAEWVAALLLVIIIMLSICHAIKKYALAKYNDDDTTESYSKLN